MSAVPGCAKVKCNTLSTIQKAGNPCCTSARLSPPRKDTKRTIDIPSGTGPCKGLTGQTLVACNAKQVVKGGIKKQSVNKTDKEQGGSGKTVPAGPNKETSDSILGSSEDWQKAIDDQMNNCFGTGIPCPMLALAVGAAIVLLLVLK